MTPEIREALESATSADAPSGYDGRKRSISPERLRSLVYAFLQEVDANLTVGELCDELCNGSFQHEERRPTW